jgi:hypothetical protein
MVYTMVYTRDPRVAKLSIRTRDVVAVDTRGQTSDCRVTGNPIMDGERHYCPELALRESIEREYKNILGSLSALLGSQKCHPELHSSVIQGLVMKGM